MIESPLQSGIASHKKAPSTGKAHGLKAWDDQAHTSDKQAHAVANTKLLRGAEMTASERLLKMFDTGTFVELDKDAHHRASAFGMDNRYLPGDGVVIGFGQIAGRTVYAFSQDRSVLGGSLGEVHAQKIIKIMELAGKCGAPVVGINDSGGARIQEGVEALAGYGDIFLRNVKYSGVVPQISLIMGPCAGGAVYSPALTDFVIMVDKKSSMFVTGPKVVRAVTSEETDTESLGGGRVHAQTSGVAHFLVKSEAEGLVLGRKLLSYLPSNNCEPAPVIAAKPPAAQPEQLRRIVPLNGNKPYSMNQLVEAIVDAGTFLEVRAGWAKNVVVGLARMAGRTVGIVANNPGHLAGVLDIDASRKAARFVRTCNAFGLPIVSLVDVPGFLPGLVQEHGGIIDHGAKLAWAYCEASVPKITVIVRKAYGGAYIVMGSKHVGADVNFAWPGAQIAVMGAEGAVEILHAKEIAQHPDPKARNKELVQAYVERFANPKIAAARGFIDMVISPEDTRVLVIQALCGLQHKRQAAVGRRNGNAPL